MVGEVLVTGWWWSWLCDLCCSAAAAAGGGESGAAAGGECEPSITIVVEDGSDGAGEGCVDNTMAVIMAAMLLLAMALVVIR